MSAFAGKADIASPSGVENTNAFTAGPFLRDCDQPQYTRRRNVFGHISGLEQATMMFFRHFLRRCLFAKGLVNTTPHPRRRGGQSVPNESRESPT
jgi:hypothetical protein